MNIFYKDIRYNNKNKGKLLLKLFLNIKINVTIIYCVLSVNYITIRSFPIFNYMKHINTIVCRIKSMIVLHKNVRLMLDRFKCFVFKRKHLNQKDELSSFDDM